MAQIQSGNTYHIINVKAGTALDLSGTDGHSIIGWTPHDGDNQKWYLEQRGNHWTFRNKGNGQYLGLGGRPRDATPLTAVGEPVEWDIWPDEEDPSTFRIFVPGKPNPINVDLSDHGNPEPGTAVILWGKWHGANQKWRFQSAN